MMTDVIPPRKRLLEDSFDITPAGLQFCFDRELFLKDEFNVDKFVIRQKRVVPLELLREDLMQYFNILKNSLVELINQDYADFVNLSTNLVGLDRVISTIEIPIEKWMLEIENVRDHFSETLSEIDKKKVELKLLRSKRELIHSIEGVHRCIIRLEKWLKIKNEEETSVENNIELLAVSEIEIGLHEDVGQRLERIGNEFSKLEYFTKKCLRHSLMEKFKPRIITITSELQTQLEKHLVESFKIGNRKSTQQVLRTYVGINKITETEQLYRDHFVSPVIEKLISSYYNVEHDLSGLYKEILTLVDELLSQLRDVLTFDNEGKYELQKDFDFLVNSIYPEIAYYFINNLPQLFSPGNPDLFHARYTSTLSFVENMEIKCSDVNHLKKLRSSKSYNDFFNKWSVAVYFQIRYQDISSVIDKNAAQDQKFLRDSDSIFHCTMIDVIYKSVLRCWDDGFYLDSLKHRFWRLNCQLLNCLVKFIENIDWIKVVNVIGTNIDHPKIQEVVNIKTMLLIDLCKFLRINSMKPLSLSNESGLRWIYTELIYPKMGLSLGGKERLSIEDVLVISTNEVIEVMTNINATIHSSLTEQCLQYIKSVQDIPRQYRRTNRPWPTKSSDYVANIFKPLLKYLDDNKELEQRIDLRSDILKKCILDITSNYRDQIKDLLLSVKKIEDSIKKLKLTRVGSSEVNLSDKGSLSCVTDDDKIHRQVSLDIEEFKEKSALILGVSLESIPEINESLRSVTEMFSVQDV